MQPFAAREKGFKLTSIEGSRVDDKPAIGVRVLSKDHRDVDLYFDKNEFVLLETSFNVKHLGIRSQGDDPDVRQETIYGNYKDFDGIKKATKIVTKFDGKLSTESELTEFKQLHKLDDNLLKP